MIDLFSGVGGLSLGFEQAGIKVVAAVEKDPIHAQTYSKNFPEVEMVNSDVRQVSGQRVREAAGLKDGDPCVLVGGAPCQGFSNIGKRLPEDPRNELVMEFVRLVGELKPAYFVLENVPGLAMGRARTLFEKLLDKIHRLGYETLSPVPALDATDFGVPQRRRRLMIVGTRMGCSVPTYPQVGHGCLVPDLQLSLRPTVGDAIGDLPDIGRFDHLLTHDSVSVKLPQPSVYASYMRCERRDPSDLSKPMSWDSGLLTASRRTVHSARSTRRFELTPPGSFESISRFYRLAVDGTANTLRAGTASDRGSYTAPRPIHPVYPRCITVREPARLQSFPDWFTFHGTIWHGFRQVGNAVPPLMARAIAIQIGAALGKKENRMTCGIGDGGLHG